MKNFHRLFLLLSCLSLSISRGEDAHSAESAHSTVGVPVAESSYGIIGDLGKWTSDAKKIQESMLRLKVKRLIMPGDNLYSLKETYEEVWNHWLEKGFLFSVTALGNHNLNYKTETAYFKMPGEYFSVVDKEIGARFIILNSDNKTNVTAQMSFLEKELKGAQEKYRFVIYHHPSFTVSAAHTWQERTEFQQKLREIAVANADRITALIWGHDHIASLYEMNQIPVLLSGSGQNPRGGGNVDIPQIKGISFQRRWLAKPVEPYWLWMDVPKKSEDLRFRFIRAQNDKVVCTFHLGRHRSLRLDKGCQVNHVAE